MLDLSSCVWDLCFDYSKVYSKRNHELISLIMTMEHKEKKTIDCLFCFGEKDCFIPRKDKFWITLDKNNLDYFGQLSDGLNNALSTRRSMSAKC